MKIFKFLAVGAVSFGMLNLVSCSTKMESLTDDIMDELADAAEILNEDCENWEDTQDAAEDLNEIADNLHEILLDLKKNRRKYEEEYLGMTPEEIKEIEKNMEEDHKETMKEFMAAREKFQKNKEVCKSASVQHALNRIDAEFRAISKIMSAIEDCD